MYKVTRSTIELKKDDPCRHNWPMQVTVEAETEDADPNVFVYHAAAYPGTDGDTFSNVASKQDMDVIPVGAPADLENEHPTQDYIPFYRTSTASFDCYNTTECERIWRIIQIDIASLVREYKAWDTLDQGNKEEVII